MLGRLGLAASARAASRRPVVRAAGRCVAPASLQLAMLRRALSTKASDPPPSAKDIVARHLSDLGAAPAEPPPSEDADAAATAAAPGAGPRGGIDPTDTALREAFDADGDGTVSAEELRRGLLAVQEQQAQLVSLTAKLTDMEAAAAQRRREAALREVELNATAVSKLLERLSDSRTQMPHAEYLEVCAEFGLEGGRAADELLGKLQASGQVLRCEGTPLGDLVLLQPQALAQRLAQAAVRPPGSSPLLARQRHAAASARLERLSKQLSALEARKKDLDGRAGRKVSRNMTLGLGVWSMQVALYYHLVYAPGALSWDVMEPVAYFTLETVTIGWWLCVCDCVVLRHTRCGRSCLHAPTPPPHINTPHHSPHLLLLLPSHGLLRALLRQYHNGACIIWVVKSVRTDAYVCVCLLADTTS
jgi:hypothetical protein